MVAVDFVTVGEEVCDIVIEEPVKFGDYFLHGVMISDWANE